VIQFSRAVLVDGVVPSVAAHLSLAGLATAVVGAGALVYRHGAPRAPERV
jgi:hypothetical protein